MLDLDKANYSCEGQMNFEECLKEIELYKWESGYYMNLPEEMEETENEHQELHPGRI